MVDKFSAKIRNGSDYTYIQIRGVIDEDNQLAGLADKISGKVVILDLGAVDRINSCGVRDWVNWLGEVEGRVEEVVMIRCSPAIVGQANMVTNFLGNAIVHSFFAPYYSPASELSVDKLLRVDQFPAEGAIKAPSFLCEDSGQPMEFDDFEDSYFAFLNAMDRHRVSERIQRLVEEVSPDLEKKIQQLNEGGAAQLTGPLNTATLMTPPHSRHSGGFSQLISSTSDARRAEAAAETAEDGAAAAAGAAPQVPAPNADPVSAPSAGGGAWRTYALLGVAGVVVVLLLVLVLTMEG